MDATVDKTMILRDHVVEVFALPERTACWELPLLLQRRESRGIGCVLIDRNHAREGRMRGSESLPEKVFGGGGIPPGTEPKVESLTRGIDGPIGR